MFPPEFVPTAGAAEGLGVRDGFGVGTGVGDGEGLGEGEGENNAYEKGEGEGEDPGGLFKDLFKAYPAEPVRITKAKIIGKEIIPKLFLGIALYRIKI